LQGFIYDQMSLILKALKSSLVTTVTRYQTNSVLYYMQTICICVAACNLLFGSLARILFPRLLPGYVKLATLQSDSVRLCPLGFFLSPVGFFPLTDARF